MKTFILPLIYIFIQNYSALAQPVELWSRTYTTGGTFGMAQSAVWDPAGYIYTTGSFGSSSVVDGYLTVKYDASGNEIWSRYEDFTVNKGDWADNIILDASGNVYVTGTTDVDGWTSTDIGTVSYSPDGTFRWSHIYNGPGNGVDKTGIRALANLRTKSIVSDNDGDIYICGTSVGALAVTEYFLMKYDGSNGAVLWSRYFGAGAAYALEIGIDGMIYVTGASDGVGGMTIKIDQYGTVQPGWPSMGGAWGELWEGFDISVDRTTGNIAVTGSALASMMYDVNTTVIDPSGNQIWSMTFNGAGGDMDYGTRVEFDASGNILVGGYAYGPWTPYFHYGDMVFIKYNGTTGLQMWQRYCDYHLVDSGQDCVYDMQLDASGNIYATGSAGAWNGSSYVEKIMTVKYNSAGTKQWTVYSTGSYGYAILLTSPTEFYVAGIGSFKTIKYGQPATPVQLTSFTADKHPDSISLSWSVAQSMGKETYIVERSSGGVAFEECGTVQSDGSQFYGFTDKNIYSGTKYYRLRINENGGEFFSQIVEVNLNMQEFIRIYPNPASSGFFYLETESSSEQSYRLEMLDMTGKKVFAQNGTLIHGNNRILVSTENLSKGMYLVKFTAGNMREVFTLMNK